MTKNPETKKNEEKKTEIAPAVEKKLESVDLEEVAGGNGKWDGGGGDSGKWNGGGDYGGGKW